MRLVLVRHGQTEENARKIIQGQSDGKLSEEGKEQARRLAERLKSEVFDVIFSSDLGRAADTTKILARYHPDTKIEFVKQLRERHTGPYTQMTWEEVDWSWDSLPDDVESDESMAIRAKPFLDSIYEQYPEGNILLVSHGGLLNSLLAALGVRPDGQEHHIPLKNTSITILEFIEKGDHKVHLLNCVEHLE